MGLDAIVNARAPALQQVTLPHVLAVDDESTMRELIAEYLGRNGFRVTTVTDGGAMQAVLAEAVVDLVVLDLRLKGEDGMALARRLREESAIPFIMVTGRNEEADMAEAIRHLAPAVTATLMSLVGWAPGYTGLAVLLTIVGLSSAAFHAVGSATAGHLSARHLGKGLSVWMVGGELGSALGPILAAGALTVLSLKGLSWLMVLGWVASFVLYLKLRNAPLHPVVSADRPGLRPSLGKMRRVLLLMAGLVMLRAMAVSAPSVFAPIFLKQEGSSSLVAGAGVALFQAAGMAGTLGAGWISDHVGRRVVLLFGALVGPASLLLFTALDGWARFPFLAMAGAATVSMHPVCMALVQETFPESRGLANALYLSMVFVISSGAAIVVGALGDSIGLRPAFVVSAVVTFLSVPLIFVLPRDRRRGSPPVPRR